MDYIHKNNGQVTKYASINFYHHNSLPPNLPQCAGRSQLDFNYKYDDALPYNFQSQEQIKNSLVSMNKSTSGLLPPPNLSNHESITQPLPCPLSYNPNIFHGDSRVFPRELPRYKRSESPKSNSLRILIPPSVFPYVHSKREKYESRCDQSDKLKSKENPCTLRNHTSDSTKAEKHTSQISHKEGESRMYSPIIRKRSEENSLNFFKNSNMCYSTDTRYDMNKDIKYLADSSNKSGCQYSKSDYKERNYSKQFFSDKSKGPDSGHNVHKIRLSENADSLHKCLSHNSDRIRPVCNIVNVGSATTLDKPKDKIGMEIFKGSSTKREFLDSSESIYLKTKVERSITNGKSVASTLNPSSDGRKVVSSEYKVQILKSLEVHLVANQIGINEPNSKDFSSRTEHINNFDHFLPSPNNEKGEVGSKGCFESTNDRSNSNFHNIDTGSKTISENQAERKNNSSQDKYERWKTVQVSPEEKLIVLKKANQKDNTNTREKIPKNTDSSSRTARINNDHFPPSINNEKSELGQGSLESTNNGSKNYAPIRERSLSQTLSKVEVEKNTGSDGVQIVSDENLSGVNKLILCSHVNTCNKGPQNSEGSSSSPAKIRNKIDGSLQSESDEKRKFGHIKSSLESNNRSQNSSLIKGRLLSKARSEDEGEIKNNGSKDESETSTYIQVTSDEKVIGLKKANQKDKNSQKRPQNSEYLLSRTDKRNNIDNSVPSANNKKNKFGGDSQESAKYRSKTNSRKERSLSKTISEVVCDKKKKNLGESDSSKRVQFRSEEKKSVKRNRSDKANTREKRPPNGGDSSNRHEKIRNKFDLSLPSASNERSNFGDIKCYLESTYNGSQSNLVIKDKSLSKKISEARLERKNTDSQDTIETSKQVQDTSEEKLIGLKNANQEDNNNNITQKRPQNSEDSSSRTAKIRNNFDHSPSRNKKRELGEDSLRSNNGNKNNAPIRDRSLYKTISALEFEGKYVSKDEIDTSKCVQVSSEEKNSRINRPNESNNENTRKGPQNSKASSSGHAKLSNKFDQASVSASNEKSDFGDSKYSPESNNRNRNLSHLHVLSSEKCLSKWISEYEVEIKNKASKDKIETSKCFLVTAEEKILPRKSNQKDNTNTNWKYPQNSEYSLSRIAMMNKIDHSPQSPNNEEEIYNLKQVQNSSEEKHSSINKIIKCDNANVFKKRPPNSEDSSRSPAKIRDKIDRSLQASSKEKSKYERDKTSLKSNNRSKNSSLSKGGSLSKTRSENDVERKKGLEDKIEPLKFVQVTSEEKVIGLKKANQKNKNTSRKRHQNSEYSLSRTNKMNNNDNSPNDKQSDFCGDTPDSTTNRSKFNSCSDQSLFKTISEDQVGRGKKSSEHKIDNLKCTQINSKEKLIGLTKSNRKDNTRHKCLQNREDSWSKISKVNRIHHSLPSAKNEKREFGGHSRESTNNRSKINSLRSDKSLSKARSKAEVERKNKGSEDKIANLECVKDASERNVVLYKSNQKDNTNISQKQPQNGEDSLSRTNKLNNNKHPPNNKKSELGRDFLDSTDIRIKFNSCRDRSVSRTLSKAEIEEKNSSEEEIGRSKRVQLSSEEKHSGINKPILCNLANTCNKHLPYSEDSSSSPAKIRNKIDRSLQASSKEKSKNDRIKSSFKSNRRSKSSSLSKVGSLSKAKSEDEVERKGSQDKIETLILVHFTSEEKVIALKKVNLNDKENTIQKRPQNSEDSLTRIAKINNNDHSLNNKKIELCGDSRDSNNRSKFISFRDRSLSKTISGEVGRRKKHSEEKIDTFKCAEIPSEEKLTRVKKSNRNDNTREKRPQNPEDSFSRPAKIRNKMNLSLLSVLDEKKEFGDIKCSLASKNNTSQSNLLSKDRSLCKTKSKNEVKEKNKGSESKIETSKHVPDIREEKQIRLKNANQKDHANTSQEHPKNSEDSSSRAAKINNIELGEGALNSTKNGSKDNSLHIDKISKTMLKVQIKGGGESSEDEIHSSKRFLPGSFSSEQSLNKSYQSDKANTSKKRPHNDDYSKRPAKIRNKFGLSLPSAKNEKSEFGGSKCFLESNNRSQSNSLSSDKSLSKRKSEYEVERKKVSEDKIEIWQRLQVTPEENIISLKKVNQKDNSNTEKRPPNGEDSLNRHEKIRNKLDVSLPSASNERSYFGDIKCSPLESTYNGSKNNLVIKDRSLSKKISEVQLERKNTDSQDTIETSKRVQITSEEKLIGLKNANQQGSNISQERPQNSEDYSSRTAKKNIIYSPPSRTNKKREPGEDSLRSNNGNKNNAPSIDRLLYKTISELELEGKYVSKDEIDISKCVQVSPEEKLSLTNKPNMSNNENTRRKGSQNSKDSSSGHAKLSNKFDVALASASNEKGDFGDSKYSPESNNRNLSHLHLLSSEKCLSKWISEYEVELKNKASQDKIETSKCFLVTAEEKQILPKKSNRNDNTNTSEKHLLNTEDCSSRPTRIWNNCDLSLAPVNNEKSDLVEGSLDSTYNGSQSIAPIRDGGSLSKMESENPEDIFLPDLTLQYSNSKIELISFRDYCFRDHKFDLSHCRINVKNLEWSCFCTVCCSHYVINLNPLIKRYLKDPEVL